MPVAKDKGVTVIGTAGSDAKKITVLSNGAAYAVNYRKESFKEVALGITNGLGVDVVYDSVGPNLYTESINSLRSCGYMVNFGNSSGPLAPIDAVELNVRGSLFFTKASMRFYQLNRQELEDSATSLFNIISRGAVTPFIGQRYKLADAAWAHKDVAKRLTVGSTILTI